MIRHCTRFILTCVLLLGLAGCSSNMNDLEQFVEDEKAKPGTRIPPIKEVRPYEKFRYSADNLRPPFSPPAIETRPTKKRSSGPQPDLNRNREYLEQFPLDTMRMVGTVNLNGGLYGLIQTDDGLVHRVLTGNHMGQNFGRITNVTPTEISLIELVQDGLGGYIQRKAGVALSEQD